MFVMDLKGKQEDAFQCRHDFSVHFKEVAVAHPLYRGLKGKDDN